jgi:DNA-directed RNA polymerase II subunit RPB1
MCIDGVNFMKTYSNSCLEIFNVLVEAARAAIITWCHGSYVDHRHLNEDRLRDMESIVPTLVH